MSTLSLFDYIFFTPHSLSKKLLHCFSQHETCVHKKIIIDKKIHVYKKIIILDMTTFPKDTDRGSLTAFLRPITSSYLALASSSY